MEFEATKHPSAHHEVHTSGIVDDILVKVLADNVLHHPLEEEQQEAPEEAIAQSTGSAQDEDVVSPVGAAAPCG